MVGSTIFFALLVGIARGRISLCLENLILIYKTL